MVSVSSEASTIWPHAEVYHHHTDSLAYLRGSKSYAFRHFKRVVHIGNQRVKLFLVKLNVLGHLAEHRLTIYIYR